MPVNEASLEETPYGRYVTSDGWFVLNLADALAVRNEEKGGATDRPAGGRRLVRRRRGTGAPAPRVDTCLAATSLTG